MARLDWEVLGSDDTSAEEIMLKLMTFQFEFVFENNIFFYKNQCDLTIWLHLNCL